MFRNILANVRAKSPLVHNITNYVTVNDCANIVLACGASPIMADDAAEVEDITSLCAGLNLNIGTLNSRTIPSMLLAGHADASAATATQLRPQAAAAAMRPATVWECAKLAEGVTTAVTHGASGHPPATAHTSAAA